ncbi:MAG: SufD family Fe-S cluster assembly protein [Verrucomicrobia bacterium]|nr:SufD family Fe-S cluster assembly protein [Verrucomicrobiota bacterium]
MLIDRLTETFLEIQDPLSSLRRKAWDRFQEMGLPDSSDEAFKYVPMERLYEEDFAPERQDVSHFVSSPDPRVIVLPITDALRTYGGFLQNRWSKILKTETDPFALLNLALHSQGVFIYVPPKTIIEEPLRCVFEGKGTYFPRIEIFLAEGSSLSLITTPMSGQLVCPLIDASVEEGAQFYHYEIDAHSQWHLGSLRAALKKDSRMTHIQVVKNAGISRRSIHVHLGGENAEVSLQGLCQLGGKSQAHTYATVEHARPHTRSMQKFKAALSDLSKSSFEGKIYVHPIAQKTEAYQRSSTLLLGEHALSYARPNLEIFADDVKASHGATVAQLNREQLFYLRSRGLNDTLAKQLLLDGFCREITSQIPYDFSI